MSVVCLLLTFPLSLYLTCFFPHLSNTQLFSLFLALTCLSHFVCNSLLCYSVACYYMLLSYSLICYSFVNWHSLVCTSLLSHSLVCYLLVFIYIHVPFGLTLNFCIYIVVSLHRNVSMLFPVHVSVSNLCTSLLYFCVCLLKTLCINGCQFKIFLWILKLAQLTLFLIWQFKRIFTLKQG